MSRFDDWKKTQFERRQDDQQHLDAIAQQHLAPQLNPQQIARERELAEVNARAHNEPLDLHLQMQLGNQEERFAAAKAIVDLRFPENREREQAAAGTSKEAAASAVREAAPERAGEQEQGQGDKGREQAPSAPGESKEPAAKAQRDIGLR